MHKSSMLNRSFAVSSVVQSCFIPGSEVRVDSQFTGACPVLWTAGLGVQPAARNRTGSGADRVLVPTGLWCRPGSGADRALVQCRALVPAPMLKIDDVVLFIPGFSTSVMNFYEH